MSITIREFQIAMETYGAEQLPSCSGSRYDILVPCFNVAGTNFIHSGSYYIVPRKKQVPEEIMNRAMAEFGEKHPGGDNFWWGEIHSIKGLLTLSAMLDGKYSKELVDELTNTTYKKLLDCPSIKNNVDFPFLNAHSPKLDELYKLLTEYSNFVNPFGSNKFKLKEPIQYLDAVNINLKFQEGKDSYTSLKLSTNSSHAIFEVSEKNWFYDILVPIQKNKKKGYINTGHYYVKENNGRPDDEIVRLDYVTNKKSQSHNPDDIDLRISLKTGLAWETNNYEQAKLVTDEQIEIMIAHLKTSIKKIKKEIIRNMINQ